jgi:hypothetical protein
MREKLIKQVLNILMYDYDEYFEDMTDYNKYICNIFKIKSFEVWLKDYISDLKNNLNTDILDRYLVLFPNITKNTLVCVFSIILRRNM